jgi:dTDP-4-dehydrorhamnose reductase
VKKVFITGISGFLGSFLQEQWQQLYEVHGCYNTTLPLNNNNCSSIELTDTKKLEALLDNVMPDVVLHTAAISSIAECEKSYDYAYNVNVVVTQFLATYCAKHNISFIFCSTDLVFDGKKGMYTENDIPNPINIYGQLKLEAEKEILRNNKNACIARLPLLVGENKRGLAGVIADLQLKNENRQPAYLFTNEYRSPAWLNDIADGFEIIMQNNISGICNVAGSEKISRYVLGLLIKQKYKLSNLKALPVTHNEIGITNRPQDASLNIDKLKQYGFNPGLLFEE